MKNSFIQLIEIPHHLFRQLSLHWYYEDISILFEDSNSWLENSRGSNWFRDLTMTMIYPNLDGQKIVWSQSIVTSSYRQCDKSCQTIKSQYNFWIISNLIGHCATYVTKVTLEQGRKLDESSWLATLLRSFQ